MKPFNFLLTAHVQPFDHPTGVDPTRFQLIAPYTSDARQWTKLGWIDRDSGRTYRITTAGAAGGGPGVARVKSYRDVITEYRLHPEAKSAGSDGTPCGATTTGLLVRRHIVAGRMRYIGKESTRLADVDAGFVHEADEVSTEYVDPRRDIWSTEILPRLREASTTAIARELGVNVSTVKRWKAGAQRAHPMQLATLVLVFCE
jgi:DNA-binding transcriptional regulator YiaG